MRNANIANTVGSIIGAIRGMQHAGSTVADQHVADNVHQNNAAFVFSKTPQLHSFSQRLPNCIRFLKHAHRHDDIHVIKTQLQRKD